MSGFLKKRAKALIAFGLLAIMAFALVPASALWSDSETITGNKVQAGTISIDLRGLDGKPINEVVSGDAIHGTGGMLPGEWTDWAKVEIYNDGTREQKQYMHLSNIVASHSGYCALHSIELARDTNGDLVPNETIGTYSFADLNGPGNRIEVGRDFGGGKVPDDYTTVLLQRVKLDASAPNSFNETGATCTWDEVFTAEQVAP